MQIKVCQCPWGAFGVLVSLCGFALLLGCGEPPGDGGSETDSVTADGTPAGDVTVQDAGDGAACTSNVDCPPSDQPCTLSVCTSEGTCALAPVCACAEDPDCAPYDDVNPCNGKLYCDKKSALAAHPAEKQTWVPPTNTAMQSNPERRFRGAVLSCLPRRPIATHPPGTRTPPRCLADNGVLFQGVTVRHCTRFQHFSRRDSPQALNGHAGIVRGHRAIGCGLLLLAQHWGAPCLPQCRAVHRFLQWGAVYYSSSTR